MKALKYDTIGKFKYDVLALVLVLALLFSGVVLGVIISPWLLTICIFSPFLGLFYQSQSLFEFRDTKINVIENKIEIQYSNGKTDRILYHEMKSIEVDIKKDFGSLPSFPVKITTNLKEYLFLFCGLNGEENLNQFVILLSDKVSCKFIDKKNIYG